MPNFVAVWADPFWTGLYFSNEIAMTGERGDEKCSIFKVCGQIRPMHPDPILAIKPSSSVHNNNDGRPSICNSIKMHFFKASTEVVDGVTETRRDFCFSTSIPLFSNGPLLQTYGLVNYNVHDESCHTLNNFRLITLNIKPTTIIPNELSVCTLSIPGPTPEHHQEVLEVANWVTDLMDYTCPEIVSNLKNIRTFPRDSCNTLLFLNLPNLFLLEKYLPPSLGPYMLCNALVLNCMSPSDFVGVVEALSHHRSPSTSSTTTTIGIPEILRVLRDTIAGMSMCMFEGKYWADKSLGQATEDQPFPISFLPGNRVFQKDDCEGRITQAQEIVKLLRRMYKAAQYQGLDAFVAQMLAIPSCESRLDLDTPTLSAIVLGCVYLGKLLYEKTIEVHTVVGDVCFAAFSSNISGDSSKKSGHSFGVIMYDDGRQQKHCAILEATGWERTRLPTSDIPVTEDESNFLKTLCKVTSERKIPILLCGHLSTEKENKVYRYMYMGNDCIFFKLPADQPSKQQQKPFPLYGPGLDLFQEGVNKFPNVKKGGMFRISIMDFLQEMSHIEKNGKASETSPWASLTSDKVKGASAILHKTKKIRARMPYIRRCLTTPTKTREEFKDLMGLWAVMPQDIIPTRTTPCAGILFSMHIHNHFQHAGGGSLSRHDFMRSTIFRYTNSGGGQ